MLLPVLTLASGILGYWTIAFTVSLWRSKESHQWFLVSSCVLNLEIPRTGNLSPPLKLDRWALASRHRWRNVEDTLWHAAKGPRRHKTSTIILSPCPWIKDWDGSSNSGAACEFTAKNLCKSAALAFCVLKCSKTFEGIRARIQCLYGRCTTIVNEHLISTQFYTHVFTVI